MTEGQKKCDCFSNEYAQILPLLEAARKSHLECIRLGLEFIAPHKVNSVHKGQTVLNTAVRYASDECVALLLRYKANPNLTEWHEDAHPLLIAVTHERKECVKLLLEAKASTEYLDWNGIETEEESILYLLLDAGFAPDQKWGSIDVQRYYIPHVWCREVTWTLLCILRKRCRIPSPGFPNGGYPLPLGIIQFIAKSVWSTRRNYSNCWSLVTKKKK